MTVTAYGLKESRTRKEGIEKGATVSYRLEEKRKREKENREKRSLPEGKRCSLEVGVAGLVSFVEF